MNKENYNSFFASITSQNRMLKFVVFILAVGWVINMVMALYALNNKMVVVIPPGATTPISVRGNFTNPETIEAWGRYLTSLAYTYDSRTIEWQIETLMSYFHPSVRPQVKQNFNRLIEEVKFSNSLSSFYIDSISYEGNKMIVRGRQVIAALNKPVRTRNLTVAIEFLYEKGQFVIISWQEVGVSE
ncbi:MAG: type IV conjugative transfer system protein TraE [Candidatus Omnitrophica bacterium]|nr:type IV conjugative transfer system protein TraE [Candidatus Omnitrophota bacterium]